MNGATWLVRALRRWGVPRIYLLCGNGLRPLMDACLAEGLPMVDVRNEQSAAYMADVEARLTRRLAVVATSAGPGHTNAITGLANSYWDGAPVLHLAGMSAAATRGRGHFQELPQVEIVAPICKYARAVMRPEWLPTAASDAVAAAISGRPGPVHLSLPADVLAATCEAPLPAARTAEVAPCQPPDEALLREAAEWLARAERPVVVAGSGCFYARAGEALRRLATMADLPVFTPLWDRGVIESPWRQYVGPTSPEVNGAAPCLGEADLVVTVGARVDYRLGCGQPPAVHPDARWLRIDVDPDEVNRYRAADLALVADPRSALARLEAVYREGSGRRHTTWLERVRAARQANLDRWAARGRRPRFPLPSLQVVRALQPFLDEEVTFLLDGGNIGRWAHQQLWNRHPEHWLTCGASGVVGWGLPGAVAAKLCRPDHPVLLLSGDGAAGFTLAEIETAIRFGTPYVAVVADDQAWGIEADARPESERGGTLLGGIRFDRVAEAIGAHGVFIEHGEQLGPAVASALARDEVTFIHVPTELGGIAYYEHHLLLADED